MCVFHFLCDNEWWICSFQLLPPFWIHSVAFLFIFLIANEIILNNMKSAVFCFRFFFETKIGGKLKSAKRLLANGTHGYSMRAPGGICISCFANLSAWDKQQSKLRWAANSLEGRRKGDGARVSESELKKIKKNS